MNRFHLFARRALAALIAGAATLLASGAEPVLRSLAPVSTALEGRAVSGAETATGRVLVSNEPDGAAAIRLDYDLSGIDAKFTPLARLNLGGVEKVKVKRPGQPASVERGAFHVFAVDASGQETLAGTVHVKPGGITNSYVIPVTDAVTAALAQTGGERKIRLVLRLTGKPMPYEVYSFVPPTLEIAPAANWTDDFAQRIAPITSGAIVYRESCLPLAASRDEEVPLRLLYPAKRVTDVIALEDGRKLEEGRDWQLRDGRVVLPRGSTAPMQIKDEFFTAERKDKDGNITIGRTTVKLMEHGWYHARQLEVSYEPAERDWQWPAARSSLEQLPRTRGKLISGAPLTVIAFGDSITAGSNASAYDGLWPYQPGYAELVARQLQEVYRSPITFMNHARGGGTSEHATTQADSQVAWFKPDLVLLAYGMNDRGENRRPNHRANLEKIIATIRARSPHTEFVVITPMVNNPAQPTGLEPVKFIRDEALKIDLPGVAFVDLTSTQLAMHERKDYLDLTGNGANHPNDFFLRVYAQRVLEVLAPAPR